MDINFEPKPAYLEVSARGRFNIDDALATFQQMLEICRETGQTCVLIDFSELTDLDSATLRVMFSATAIALYERYMADGGHALRLAFFGSFLSWQPGLELTPRNSPGVQTFTDREAARAWLGR